VPRPRPNREAASFSFRIEITHDWLDQSAKDFEYIRIRLQSPHASPVR